MNQPEGLTSFQRLAMFIRVNALALFVFSFCREDIFSGHSSATLDLLFDSSKVHIPLLNLPWASLNPGFYSYAASWAQRIGALLVFYRPKSRVGHLLVVSGMLFVFLLSFDSLGITTASIYFLFFTIFLVEPPSEQNADKLIRRMTGYIAMIYACSVLAKLNSIYFGGDPVLKRLSYLSRSSLGNLLHYPAIAFVINWSGLLTQAAIAFLLSNRWRSVGITALILFHLALNTTLCGLTGAVFFALSVPLLYIASYKTHRYFQILTAHCLILPVLMVGVSSAGRLLFWNYDGYIYDALTVIPIFILSGYAIALLNPLEARPFALSKLGWSLPFAYFAMAVLFNLPEPFGYRQYSGHQTAYYGVLVRTNPSTSSFWRHKLQSRWTMRFIWSGSYYYSWAMFFPFREMPEQALKYMCSQSPNIAFKRFETPALTLYDQALIKAVHDGQVVFKDWRYKDCRSILARTSPIPAEHQPPTQL